MSNPRLKKNWTLFYHASILLRGAKYRAAKRFGSNTLKRNELKVYISLKGNKLVCFGNSSDSFQVATRFGSWFLKKKWYHRMHVSSRCTCGTKSLNKAYKNLCTIFSNLFSPEINFMRTSGFYRHQHFTKGRSFKTFLKQNYAVALDSCYMFIEHEIKHDACLWSFHTLCVPELYCSFNEYLVI